MPLPDDPGLSWPPPTIAGAAPKFREWSTWYGNDPDALAGYYGSRASQAGPRARPSQLAGGVVGGLARFFWGTPTAVGQQRAKVHLPIASDIATASADLLFSEEVKVEVPDELKKTPQAARLEELLDAVSWSSFLVEQAEPASALGGVYHRVVWDRKVADHPLVTAVHADLAWPEFAFGRMVACTFWDDVVRRDQYVLRILERHELGRIEYGLYEGTPDELGRRVDFGAATGAGFAMPDVDEESSIATGPRVPLTATYVPNLKPVRSGWRLDPVLKNLGRSDLDGIEPLLDSADEVMTSWLRDLRLGKARIIVPEWMLKLSTAEGRGSFFNADQEAFVALHAASDADAGMAEQITAQQFEIRSEQHAATLAATLAAAFRGAGYSQQTFGIAGEGEGGGATATEVNARESRSVRTREKKSRYQSDALPHTLAALIAVDEVHFHGAQAASGWRPRVVFPDVTRLDPQSEATTISLLRAAQALSIYQSVKRVNPDWDETDVAEEVQRIVDDEKALTPALPDLGPLPDDKQAESPGAGQS